MRKEHRIVAALALLACLLPPVLTGCGKEPSVIDEKISIPVYMSVSTPSEGVSTKMTDKIVQNDNPQTFRGIQNFYIIPFYIAKQTSGGDGWREVVQAGDPCFAENIQMTGRLQQHDFTGAGPAKGFYSLVSSVYSMTNSVLVYGVAKEEAPGTAETGSVAFRQHNGVIVPGDNVTNRPQAATTTAGDITFDLQSILNAQKANYDKWLEENLDMLTAIANAQLDNGAKFKDNADLRPAFNAFTGTVTSGSETTSGAVFSVANEGAVLTRLYAACQTIIASASTEEETKKLAEKVCEVIKSYTTGTSPMLAVSEAGVVTLKQDASTKFGLPAGAIAIQWGEWKVGATEGSFGSPDKSEGVNLAAIEDYCFPPALWYYVNSPLLGSIVGGLSDMFAYPAWSDIVNAMGGDKNRGIILQSKAALVRDPLQYAVAMLRFNLNGPATEGAKTLKDNAGADISIEGKHFPLTGIILGGQRTQNFDFTASKNDMRFTYDADVNNDQGATKAWLSSSVTSATQYTLAFSTLDKEDVYFALEFRNDSGKSFVGAHGITILPGSKFYLIGKMVYEKGQYGDEDDTTPKTDKPLGVFVKDRITTLSVKFKALSAAYAFLPEMATQDLQMGVTARLNWDVVTPYSSELQ